MTILNSNWQPMPPDAAPAPKTDDESEDAENDDTMNTICARIVPQEDSYFEIWHHCLNHLSFALFMWIISL